MFIKDFRLTQSQKDGRRISKAQQEVEVTLIDKASGIYK
jgi:hypothetical protein